MFQAYKMTERSNVQMFSATHLAIILNSMQNVANGRSLSTAEHRGNAFAVYTECSKIKRSVEDLSGKLAQYKSMQCNVPYASMYLHCPLAHNNNQTSYEVQYRGVDSPNNVDATFSEAVTVPVGMTLSHTISDLLAYSAYNVSVRATNQYGVGDFSEEVTVRTEEGGECVALYSTRTNAHSVVN